MTYGYGAESAGGSLATSQLQSGHRARSVPNKATVTLVVMTGLTLLGSASVRAGAGADEGGSATTAPTTASVRIGNRSESLKLHRSRSVVQYVQGCPACCCQVKIAAPPAHADKMQQQSYAKTAMRACLHSHDLQCHAMCREWMKEKGLKL